MKKGLSKFLQLKINIYICQVLGWWFAGFYVTMLGRFYFLINVREREKIIQSIEKVFDAHQNQDEIYQISQNVFHGIIAHYYEKIYNAYSSFETLKNFFRGHVEDSGISAIREGLAKQKGVLLITGHFGGVEFMPCFLAARDFPVTIVARFSSAHLRRISIRRAEQFGIKIIDVDNTPNVLRDIFEHLKENRVVITQCDEIDEWKPSRQSATIFLGKCIRRDRTIDIMARRGDAAIVFALMRRTKPGKYRFTAKSLQEMAQALQTPTRFSLGELVLKVLEQYIYKHPEDWYQWKKYLDVEALPSDRIRVDRPLTLPLLEPSFGVHP